MEYKREYFSGKTAVVTGAASGIGLALVEELLLSGAAKVMMADTNAGRLDENGKRLNERYGDRVKWLQCDVSAQEQVQSLIDQSADYFDGRIDMLFNNAGIGWYGAIRKASLADWRRVIDINLWGVIYGIDAVLPIMLRQKNGHIINTASIWGLLPGVFESIYSTSKHAVVGLSESLRYELENDGIHVSVVCPGPVATAIFPEGHAPPGAISPVEAVSVILEGIARKDGIIVVTDVAVKGWEEFRASSDGCADFFRERVRQLRP